MRNGPECKLISTIVSSALPVVNLIALARLDILILAGIVLPLLYLFARATDPRFRQSAGSGLALELPFDKEPLDVRWVSMLAEFRGAK